MPKDEARDAYFSHLTKIVAGAVKQCLDAHGQVDPGSVAKQVVSRLWHETDVSAHPSLADWIRHVRGERGLSQLELAQLLDVQPVTVSRWELGKAQPRERHIEEIRAIARQAPPTTR